jgi:hypothetical protein
MGREIHTHTCTNGGSDGSYVSHLKSGVYCDHITWRDFGDNCEGIHISSFSVWDAIYSIRVGTPLVSIRVDGGISHQKIDDSGKNLRRDGIGCFRAVLSCKCQIE